MIEAAMIGALDTNILLRITEPGHSQHATTMLAVAKLRRHGYRLYVFPQMLYEFWAVATRPIAANGLGKSAAEADALVAILRRHFPIIPDIPRIFPEWLRLVSTHNVLGKPAHDARLAAAMAVHGITHILTFNTADFARYPAVTALDPHAVVAGSVP